MRTEKKTLYLHIGLPKTATSFLQEDVFKHIPSCQCLVKPSVVLNNETVRFSDLFSWSPKCWKKVGENPFECEGHIVDTIISDEAIFGGISHPSPWLDDVVDSNGDTVELRRDTRVDTRPNELSSHLKEIKTKYKSWGFSDLKVLMGIRRQDTLLASYYAQKSDRIRGARQSHFEDWVRHILFTKKGYYKKGGSKLEYFSWFRVISNVLSKKNVYIYTLEQIKDNSSKFFEQLLSFLGIQDNICLQRHLSKKSRRDGRSESNSIWSIQKPKRTGPGLPVGRLFSLIGLPIKIALRSPDFLRQNKIQLNSKLSDEVLGVFESDNKKIDKKITPVSLSQYGYY